MKTMLLSGAGRYADPWHPYPETSGRIRAVLEGDGRTVELREDIDDAMQALDDVDLLVVNAGDPWREDDTRLHGPDRSASLHSALERGIGVVAVHWSVASLRDYPDWAAATGGVWTTGSFHPPFGRAHVTGGALPDGSPVSSFDVDDERYCSVQQIGPHHCVATHDGSFGPEPTAWVREHLGSRVAVDLLGHDTRSWDSEGRVELFRALTRWVTSPR